MSLIHKYRFISFCLLLVCGLSAQAQTDSTSTIQLDSGQVVLQTDKPIENIKETSALSPKEAAKRSAIFPGWGQIYNKKYWKLPIIYGIAGGVGYGIALNSHRYQVYNNSYESALLNGNPAGLNLDQLRYLRNQHRRWKEQLIIVGIAVYSLNIVDAIVDAHLSTFDLDDNISFKFKPQYETIGFGGNSTLAGLSFVLKF